MLVQNVSFTLSVSVLASVALPLGLVLALLVCLQCFKKQQGFSNFGQSTTSLNTDAGQINSSFTLNVEDVNGDVNSSTVVTIEPLPDISSKLKQPAVPLRPQIGFLGRDRQDASLNLITIHHPFPRNQIVYLKELGSGWFGKVIESDAERIITGVARSKVVVKMLKDDASQDERQRFFEEVAPYRELEHSNIVRLLGQCSESTPLLMIMEAAAYGNLKQYLKSHQHSEALLIQKNRLMQFAVDASCGLACLHRHDYLHRDMAARNCLVMSDYTLKIGDYGIAEDLFKEDYVTSGNDLLPIRWMAPETLKQENGTWTSCNFSKDSDMWSLGVVLWEIATMGGQPYNMLTDGDVLQRVFVDRDIVLPQPDIHMPGKDRLYEVMRFCWLDSSQRIKVDDTHRLLQQITNMITDQTLSDNKVNDFEEKWEHLAPSQHHLSTDSIDDQLACISRGDSQLFADLSQPNSFEDLTASGIDHQTGSGRLCVDQQSGSFTKDAVSVHQDNFPVTKDQAPTIPFLAVTEFPATAKSLTNVSVAVSDSTTHSEQEETSTIGSSDFSVIGQQPSCCEDSDLSFEILDSSADMDKAGGQSQNFQLESFPQSSTTDHTAVKTGVSTHDDNISGEFIDMSEKEFIFVAAKDSSSSPPASNPAAFSEPACLAEESECLKVTNEASISASDSGKLSPDVKIDATDTQQDIVSFVSIGSDLSSQNSLPVQTTMDSEQEESFPSVSTEGLVLPSTGSRSEPENSVAVFDQIPESQWSHSKAAFEESMESDQLSLDDSSFDALSSLPDVTDHAPAVDVRDSSEDSKENDDAVDMLENLNNLQLQTDAVEKQQTVCPEDSLPACDNQSDTKYSLTVMQQNSGSNFADCASKGQDSIDIKQSEGTGHTLQSSTILNKPSSGTVNRGRGLLQNFSSHAQSSLPTASSDDANTLGACCMEEMGNSFSSDTDSSSNSDSGKDYICEDPWGDTETSSPPPSSPTSSVDSEEYALQLASEIYLSKGLKMGRPFESTFLEPIPEDPIPSISEESVAPTPSETSSVDVRFDDVFEWDDFMGEPLVGKERASPDSSSKECFDMQDWSLDVDPESLPSVSGAHSQLSDAFHVGSGGSDCDSAGFTDSSYSRLSVTDNETASHGRSRTHRSYVSDLLSNRTKGLALNTVAARTQNQSKFYSLYEEDFDLESDSQSDDGNSPPVADQGSESAESAGRGEGFSLSHAFPTPKDAKDSASSHTQDF